MTESSSPIPPQFAPPSETASTASAPVDPVMREAQPTAEEIRAYDAALSNRNATLKAMVITLAVVMAPFIGLLYDLKVGIGLLGLGLLFTAVVTWSGANRMNPSSRTKARFSAMLNGILALVAFIVFATMLTSS
jgi:hypothetical protein